MFPPCSSIHGPGSEDPELCCLGSPVELVGIRVPLSLRPFELATPPELALSRPGLWLPLDHPGLLLSWTLASTAHPRDLSSGCGSGHSAFTTSGIRAWGNPTRPLSWLWNFKGSRSPFEDHPFQQPGSWLDWHHLRLLLLLLLVEQLRWILLRLSGLHHPLPPRDTEAGKRGPASNLASPILLLLFWLWLAGCLVWQPTLDLSGSSELSWQARGPRADDLVTAAHGWTLSQNPPKRIIFYSAGEEELAPETPKEDPPLRRKNVTLPREGDPEKRKSRPTVASLAEAVTSINLALSQLTEQLQLLADWTSAMEASMQSGRPSALRRPFAESSPPPPLHELFCQGDATPAKFVWEETATTPLSRDELCGDGGGSERSPCRRARERLSEGSPRAEQGTHSAGLTDCFGIRRSFSRDGGFIIHSQLQRCFGSSEASSGVSS